MRWSKRLRRGLTVALVRFFLWFFNRLPRSVAQWLGGRIGAVAWRFADSARERADYTLDLAYGDSLSGGERTTIVRQFFIDSGKNLADVMRMRRSFNRQLLPLITAEGMEHLEAAYARGKGAIGVTGHIGNFELLAAYLAVATKFKIAVIAREMYDRRLDAMLVANREALGLVNFSTSESPRFLLRWLKNNGGIGVLIDTDSHRVRSDFVPWFGKPAYTPVGHAILGLKADALFLPMACVRTPEDTYHVIVRPAVSSDRTDDIEADARRLTAACVVELEKIIDQHRSQWIWIHNRWHTQNAP